MSSPDTTIRPATLRDAFALAGIYRETWRATFSGILPEDYIETMISRRGPAWWQRSLSRGGVPLVLEADGEARAYVNFGRSRYGDSPYEGEIYEINVHPSYQRRGFGKQLLGAARDKLEADGLHGLTALALEANAPACAFLEAMGGTKIGRSEVRFATFTLPRIAYGWKPEG